MPIRYIVNKTTTAIYSAPCLKPDLLIMPELKRETVTVIKSFSIPSQRHAIRHLRLGSTTEVPTSPRSTNKDLLALSKQISRLKLFRWLTVPTVHRLRGLKQVIIMFKVAQHYSVAALLPGNHYRTSNSMITNQMRRIGRLIRFQRCRKPNSTNILLGPEKEMPREAVASKLITKLWRCMSLLSRLILSSSKLLCRKKTAIEEETSPSTEDWKNPIYLRKKPWLTSKLKHLTWKTMAKVSLLH